MTMLVVLRFFDSCLVLLLLLLSGLPSSLLAFSPAEKPPRSSVVVVVPSVDKNKRLFSSKVEKPAPPVSSSFVAFSDDIIPILRDDDENAKTVIMESASTTEFTSDNTASLFQQATQFVESNILGTYWGPRVVLAVIAAVYGTNFALGSLMNDALPASGATAARMVLASAALAPFVWQIKDTLRTRAVLCGCCTALGYVTQSLALCDADPARVSFLGAATVLWCPFLEWSVDKTPMSWKEAPQTWLAAFLCLTGVGILELYNPGAGEGAGSSLATLSMDSIKGDVLALLQAVGFGTGCFLSAKMVREEPDQVLPVTSVLIATTAFLSMLWSLADGWIGQPGWQNMALPGMLFDADYHQVALAVLWTGLISTSLNFVIEISALARVPSSEASVLLASEPIWAALFAAGLLGETMGINDYLGGAFIIAACLVNAVLRPEHIRGLFGAQERET